MTEPHLFSDEVLTAYLDNEVDISIMNAIEDALISDAALNERLASLQFPTRALNSAFEGLLAVAPVMPDLPASTEPVEPHRTQRLAMAACLVLGVAMGAGLMSWRAHQPVGWMDYVAAYQALYVNATLTSVETDQDETAANLAALGAALGYELSAAENDSVLEFKRGQLLGYKGSALVQLAYLSPLGEPVALCIIRSEGAGASDISVVTLEGMAAAHWEKDGFAFLLIGGTDSALIKGAADRMAERL